MTRTRTANRRTSTRPSTVRKRGQGTPSDSHVDTAIRLLGVLARMLIRNFVREDLLHWIELLFALFN